MKDSGWRWNRRLTELNAAHAWGCPDPGYFDSLPKDTRLDILAWYEVKWRVENINAWESREAAIREAKRKAKKGKRAK